MLGCVFLFLLWEATIHAVPRFDLAADAVYRNLLFPRKLESRPSKGRPLHLPNLLYRSSFWRSLLLVTALASLSGDGAGCGFRERDRDQSRWLGKKPRSDRGDAGQIWLSPYANRDRMVKPRLRHRADTPGSCRRLS